MKKPKASIIIPVYNVEDYLAECLLSAISQDYHNKEVIVINDGSTDNSSSILKEIQRKHPELIIIETANRGQSNARNTGIDAATGEYIIFLDSDDWIEKNTLSRCFEAIVEHNVDMVMFSANAFADNLPSSATKSFNYNHPLQIQNRKLPSKDYFSESITLKNYIVQPCLYLYSKTKLDSVKFLPNIIHEDNLFTTNLLLKEDNLNIICIPDKLYNRRIRPDSIMTQVKNNHHINGYFSVAENLLSLRSIEDEKQTTAALNTFTQNMIINAIDTCRLAYNNHFPKIVRVKSRQLLMQISIRDIKFKTIAYIAIPELTILKAYIKKTFKKNDTL